VTLALIFEVNVTLGVCCIALLIAFLLSRLFSRTLLASDTLLGLLSHTLLALGLLTLAVREEIQIDVLGFLYGDILAIAWQDVLMIYAGGGSMLVLLLFLWTPLLRITVHPELAAVEGVDISKIQTAYLVLLAIVVAIAMKIVGILLITALLIIPAAAAHPFAKNPEQMAGLASFLGVCSVALGMLVSHTWDVPTGPAIVVIAAGFFVVTTAFKYKFALSH